MKPSAKQLKAMMNWEVITQWCKPSKVEEEASPSECCVYDEIETMPEEGARNTVVLGDNTLYPHDVDNAGVDQVRMSDGSVFKHVVTNATNGQVRLGAGGLYNHVTDGASGTTVRLGNGDLATYDAGTPTDVRMADGSVKAETELAGFKPTGTAEQVLLGDGSLANHASGGTNAHIRLGDGLLANHSAGGTVNDYRRGDGTVADFNNAVDARIEAKSAEVIDSAGLDIVSMSNKAWSARPYGNGYLVGQQSGTSKPPAGHYETLTLPTALDAGKTITNQSSIFNAFHTTSSQGNMHYSAHLTAGSNTTYRASQWADVGYGAGSCMVYAWLVGYMTTLPPSNMETGYSDYVVNERGEHQGRVEVLGRHRPAGWGVQSEQSHEKAHVWDENGWYIGSTWIPLGADIADYANSTRRMAPAGNDMQTAFWVGTGWELRENRQGALQRLGTCYVKDDGFGHFEVDIPAKTRAVGAWLLTLFQTIDALYLPFVDDNGRAHVHAYKKALMDWQGQYVAGLAHGSDCPKADTRLARELVRLTGEEACLSMKVY